MRSLVLPVTLCLAASLLAGCFGGDEVPAERQFSASGGKVSEGYDYEGATLAAASASLSGSLHDPENRGAVNVTFEFLGSPYVVQLREFAGAQEFHDGGVRFEFDEHGDTGAGDALLPKMRVKAAAWGTATVTKAGMPLGGVAGNLWSAHLMISDDSVRGADGKILNAAGSAPYNPASPTDARVVAGDPQAFLVLKSPDGETAKRAPTSASTTLTFAGPEQTQTVPIPAELGAASLTVNVTIAGDPAPVPVGRAMVSLKDANGNVTSTQELTLLPNQPSTASFTVEGADITGAYTLDIVGTGAFSATVDSLVAYDDHPFLVVTWDEITLT